MPIGGGRGLSPEHTIAAYKKALKVGADVLEIDAHATRDGEMVVIHDPTVDRTTNGKGGANELTLSEIKGLDAGYRFAVKKTVKRIIPLGERDLQSRP